MHSIACNQCGAVEKAQIDKLSITVLSFALRKEECEHSCISYNKNCALYFEENQPENNNIFVKIVKDDQKHVEEIQRVLTLMDFDFKQVTPENNVTFACNLQKHQQHNVLQLIIQSISKKLDAIAEYNKMLFVIKNKWAKQFVEKILIDEQQHLQTLQRAYYQVKNKCTYANI